MTMERLNLRTPKPYGKSTQEESSFNKHIFIVSEGQTEETYFRGVKNYRSDLHIKNSIEILVIEKEDKDQGKSHPRQLVDAALIKMGRLNKDLSPVDKDQWQEHCEWDYDPDDDMVCVVFDKDYKGLEKEIDYIYDMCSKHKIYIGFSNPNFEFWLLLHFENIGQYSRELLLSNPKNIKGKLFPGKSKSKKYLQILLSIRAEGYKKGSSLKFEKFKDRISLAIKQEKEFEEDVYQLFYNLGSNIGLMIEMIKDN